MSLEIGVGIGVGVGMGCTYGRKVVPVISYVTD